VENNVALELVKSIIFPYRNQEITIERDENNGGNLLVRDYCELQALFSSSSLHPSDLKTMVAKEVNAIFDPVRSQIPEAKRNEIIAPAFPSSKGSGGKKK